MDLEFKSQEDQEFPLLHVVHTGSEAHLASYPMGTKVKRPGSEADNSPTAIAEVKRMWIYTTTPHTP
jgi:hypothetical protein